MAVPNRAGVYNRDLSGARRRRAQMAELVDAPDLGSGAERRGSSPFLGTNNQRKTLPALLHNLGQGRFPHL